MLKTAREGRAWAMLYEEGTTRDRYLMTFESRLFGLRLRQTGMNTFSEAGRLYRSGSWQRESRAGNAGVTMCDGGLRR